MLGPTAKHMLEILGLSPVTERPGWVVSPCPFGPWRHANGTSNPHAFGIKVEGESFVTCFSCGYSGDPEFMLTELRHMNRVSPHYAPGVIGEAIKFVREANDPLYVPSWDQQQKRAAGTQVVPWPDWFVDSFASWRESEEVSEYLHSRGISEEVADALELKVDYRHFGVGFPLRDYVGSLCGLRTRVLDPNYDFRFYDWKYHGHSSSSLVWLGEHHINTRLPVVLVEGNFDYAKVYSVYRNVLTSQTTGLSKEKIKRLIPAKKLVLFFDNDEAGRKASSKVIETLGAAREYYEVQYRGPEKDPGGMSQDALKECLSPYCEMEC